MTACLLENEASQFSQFGEVYLGRGTSHGASDV